MLSNVMNVQRATPKHVVRNFPRSINAELQRASVENALLHDAILHSHIPVMPFLCSVAIDVVVVVAV